MLLNTEYSPPNSTPTWLIYGNKPIAREKNGLHEPSRREPGGATYNLHGGLKTASELEGDEGFAHNPRGKGLRAPARIV